MENNNNSNNSEKKGIGRRDLIKGLAAVPVLGALAFSTSKKNAYDQNLKNSILRELNIDASTPPPTGPMAGDPVRLGIIGYGIRGKQLVKAAGFMARSEKEKLQKSALENPNDTRLKDFMEQENLNVRFTGVCDLFDVRAEEALDTVTTDDNKPKRFRTYQEMLASPDIDGVIIATPDHWHAPISIDAARAGKHVYVEKCMTHKVNETYELYDAVKTSGIVFQVGHQHRQTQSFVTAQDVLRKNVLGHVSLVQACTNRNSDNGAWQYNIHEKASPETIDWQQFLGNAPQIPFNKEHFFRWRKWWEYGSGLAGDLLTHDYDRINCLFRMGIPKSATASGGIYTHKDGRDVPDVYHVVMEYPDFQMGTSQEKGKEKGFTFMYSATLGNQFGGRNTLLMGHDATLELLGNTITVHADPRSTRYKEMIKDKMIDPEVPLYSYNPMANGVDGVTSATAKYFANKGLLFTYRNGKRVDSTHLHIREWLSGIRNGTKVSCGIEEGFEEAISAHMTTLAFKLGRKIEWDADAKKIINVTEEEINQCDFITI